MIWWISKHLILTKHISYTDHSDTVKNIIIVLIIHNKKLKITDKHILQKWQKVKVVRRAIPNMTATFTDSVNAHAMTELQDRL